MWYERRKPIRIYTVEDGKLKIWPQYATLPAISSIVRRYFLWDEEQDERRKSNHKLPRRAKSPYTSKNESRTVLAALSCVSAARRTRNACTVSYDFA